MHTAIRENLQGSNNDCSQDSLQKNAHFANFHILKLFLESWFSAVTKGCEKFIEPFRMLHGIQIISRVLIGTTARPISWKKMHFAKFRILQLLLKCWSSVFRRSLGNFLESRIFITVSKLHKKLELSSEKFANFRILQLFLESWFSANRKGFDNFTAT